MKTMYALNLLLITFFLFTLSSDQEMAIFINNTHCAGPENILLPLQKGLEFPEGWGAGGGGFSKTKTFKEMYEAYLEFPEG